MQICYSCSPMLVFQCSSCGTVLSDSLLFSCSIEALNTVVVTGLNESVVDAIPQSCSLLQKSVRDSSYLALTCKCCGSAVGRLYTDVPVELAVLHSKFALDVNKTRSYTLGQPEIQCAAGSEETQVVPVADGSTQVPSSPPGLPSDSVLLQRIAQLESDMLKVQNMLLLHSECLEQVGRSPGPSAMHNMTTPSGKS